MKSFNVRKLLAYTNFFSPLMKYHLILILCDVLVKGTIFFNLMRCAFLFWHSVIYTSNSDMVLFLETKEQHIMMYQQNVTIEKQSLLFSFINSKVLHDWKQRACSSWCYSFDVWPIISSPRSLPQYNGLRYAPIQDCFLWKVTHYAMHRYVSR